MININVKKDRQDIDNVAIETQKMIVDIESVFNKKLNFELLINIHDTRDQYDKTLNRKTFDWEVGNTNKNRIDILHPNSFEKYSSHKKEEFLPTLKHELVHVYLNQLIRDKIIPLWLNEGIANFVSGQVDKYREANMYIEEDFLKKISSEAGWSQYSGGCVYVYSALFIDYIANKYSFEKVILLVLKARKNYYFEEFNVAFKEIFGIKLEDVEKDFIGYLNNN
ncbi:MAG: basic secretory protein-like protein [bacterium]